MKRLSICVFVTLWLSCGSVPPENDGGTSAPVGGGRTGGGSQSGGGSQAGGGGGTGGGGEVGGGGGEVGGGGGEVGGGGGTVGGGGGGGGASGGGSPSECSPADTRACCASRGMQTCTAAGTWGPCSASGVPEVCNGADDDCDGQIDNGITFSPGELADAGVGADGGCMVGVGACQRTGGATCNAFGMVSCSATAGAPVTETCNSIDDNCDGVVDEGLRISCLPDADNDRAPTPFFRPVDLCPDSSRPDFGNCPQGYVAPGMSLGPDCAPSDPLTFQLRSVRTDADGDAYCVMAAFNACSGATFPAGTRDPSTCRPTDDCDDTQAARFANVNIRTDADADHYCVGAQRIACVGATAPSGTQAASDCRSTDDCDDTSPSRYAVLQVRTDADNDLYCVGSVQSLCGDLTTPPGTRPYGGCNSDDDCNDSNAAIYRLAALRVDSDNDGYCTAAAATSVCIGTAAPGGYKLAAACNATNDCKDTNPNANTTCLTNVTSTSFSKTCGIGPPPSQSGNVTFSCPFNFSPIIPATDNATNGNISCTHASFANGQTIVQVTGTCATAYTGTGLCFLTARCLAN